jgi:hypothetical protein
MPISEQNGFVSEVRKIVQQMGGKKPAGSILTDPELASVIAKLQRPRDRVDTAISNPDGASGMTVAGAQEISRSIMARMEDNQNTMQLFPDIELAEQIVISSILAPKDMGSSELIYKLTDNRFPAVLTNELLGVLKEHISKNYKLREQCSDILSDAMFKKGSHVKAILPESAVDELINSNSVVATENIFPSDIFADRTGSSLTSMNLLGSPVPKDTTERRNPKYVLESIVNAGAGVSPSIYNEDESVRKALEGLVEVTDNYNLLKFQKLVDAISVSSVRKAVGTRLDKASMTFATESYKFFEGKKAEGKMTEEQMKQLLYRNSVSQYKPFLTIPSKDNLRRKSVGRPMVIDIPSEAAVPIHVPGSPAKHIGYMVPVDADGNFITLGSAFDNATGMAGMMSSDKSNSSLGSLLTEKARKNLATQNDQPTIENATEIYADIIEKDFLQRLANGKYGRELRIGRNMDIMRIMLIRALKAQFTRLVYVPAEYVTYFAFKYHDNGVGKSYLDDLANITSLRALVLFSKTMARVKSSIETTHVNVKLDPRDHDPAGTLEKAKHLIAKTRQQFFPHGLNRVVDLTDWISRAGIQITFEGHPKMPTTSFDFETKNMQHPPPDDGLEEDFRYQTYMHFGLSPDAVDTAAKSDFATVIEKSSIMFSKRVTVWSDAFSEDLTDYARKILNNDNELIDALLEVLKNHKSEIDSMMTDEEKEFYTTHPKEFSEFLIYQFSSSLKVDLPKPEFTSLQNMNTSFSDRANAYKAAIEYVIDESVLPSDLGGEASNYVATLQKVWLAGLMRKWMAENNYVPEVMEISQLSEEGKPAIDLLELTESHSKNLMLAVATLLNKVKSARVATDADLAKINAGDSSSSGVDTSSSSSSEDTGGGEEGGGEDDFSSNPFEDNGGEEGGEGGDAGGDENLTDPGKNPFA